MDFRGEISNTCIAVFKIKYPNTKRLKAARRAKADPAPSEIERMEQVIGQFYVLRSTLQVFPTLR